MIASLMLVDAAVAGQALPPQATALDMAFAYGAVALLVGLVVWQSRSSQDPPAA